MNPAKAPRAENNMKSSTDILLVVDHKWRDLPGMAALAVWLEEGFGVTSKLISYAEWYRSIIRFRPRVIAVSILFGSRGRDIANIAHQMGAKVAVIMTEGRPNNDQNLDYSVGKESGAQRADLWFAWSDTVRDYMIEQGVLPPEKLHVAGCNRFDVYAPPLNQLIAPRHIFAERYGLDADKPIISWATNFTHAKFHLNNQSFLVKNWQDLGLTRYPAYSNPIDFARLDFEAREHSLRSIRYLLKAKPDVQLILKPHPGEDHDTYARFVSECRKEFGPRIVFVNYEYIWDVLNAADVHVHRLCTTGVEAWFLDVPSIDYHVKDYYIWSRQLPGAASEAVDGNDLVEDERTLVDRIDHYLQGGAPTAAQMAARQRYIQRWLYKVDGYRSMEYARVLTGLLNPGSRIGMPAFNVSNLRLTSRAYAAVLWRSYRKALGLVAGNGRAQVDKIGQVDKMISDADEMTFTDTVRAVLRPAIRTLGDNGANSATGHAGGPWAEGLNG